MGKTVIDLETASDQDILARTLYGEARGEAAAGMEDVACVVMNRANKAKLYYALHNKPHPLFGDGSPKSACLAPWQFSSWNENDPNREALTSVASSNSVFANALTIAQQAVSGDLHDRTQGATYYFAVGTTVPSWAKRKTPCFIEGRHQFFNDI